MKKVSRWMVVVRHGRRPNGNADNREKWRACRTGNTHSQLQLLAGESRPNRDIKEFTNCDVESEDEAWKKARERVPASSSCHFRMGE